MGLHGVWEATRPAVYWLGDGGDDHGERQFAAINSLEVVDERLHGQDAGAAILQLINDLPGQRLLDACHGSDGLPTLRTSRLKVAFEVVND